MISVGREEGTVEEAEAKMLHKVFDFGDRPVHEVMVPRLEVAALQQGSTISDFLRLYTESPISRFPVTPFENMPYTKYFSNFRCCFISIFKCHRGIPGYNLIEIFDNGKVMNDFFRQSIAHRFLIRISA